MVQAFLEKNSTQVSALGFKLSKNSNEEEVRAAVNSVLGDKVIVLNRRELNSTLYRMLNTENMATYLIFTLVLIIALFNVVGAIIMMILDKKQNLKTLFALGAEIKEIKRIFIKQGFLLSQVGLYIGIALSLILILLQQNFELLMITRTLAYPVELKWTNFLLVILTISVLGYVAAKISASRINKSLIEQI